MVRKPCRRQPVICVQRRNLNASQQIHKLNLHPARMHALAQYHCNLYGRCLLSRVYPQECDDLAANLACANAQRVLPVHPSAAAATILHDLQDKRRRTRKRSGTTLVAPNLAFVKRRQTKQAQLESDLLDAAVNTAFSYECKCAPHSCRLAVCELGSAGVKLLRQEWAGRTTSALVELVYASLDSTGKPVRRVSLPAPAGCALKITELQLCLRGTAAVLAIRNNRWKKVKRQARECRVSGRLLAAAGSVWGGTTGTQRKVVLADEVLGWLEAYLEQHGDYSPVSGAIMLDRVLVDDLWALCNTVLMERGTHVSLSYFADLFRQRKHMPPRIQMRVEKETSSVCSRCSELSQELAAARERPQAGGGGSSAQLAAVKKRFDAHNTWVISIRRRYTARTHDAGLGATSMAFDTVRVPSHAPMHDAHKNSHATQCNASYAY
jgi:hypothetical protein